MPETKAPSTPPALTVPVGADPAAGGSYVREDDGSLTRTAGTEPVDAQPTPSTES